MSNRMILLSFGCEKTGRGKTAAPGKMRVDERGKTAALKMKTPRSYSEVPRINYTRIKRGKTAADT